MIAVAAILDRLKERLQGDAFRFVGAAKDFLEAAEQTPASPALFVLIPAERASQQTALTGVTRQRIAVQFTFVMSFVRVGAKGESGIERAETCREAVKDALLGWRPQGASEPFIYGGSRLLAMTDDKTGMFYGLDVASAYHDRRSES